MRTQLDKARGTVLCQHWRGEHYFLTLQQQPKGISVFFLREIDVEGEEKEEEEHDDDEYDCKRTSLHRCNVHPLRLIKIILYMLQL